MPAGLPVEPVRKLQLAISRSKRKTSVRFPVAFVRQQLTGEDPPLARLFRGGEVRLKLYLALAMIATKEPYDINDCPSSSWLASMLNLPDPTGSGARRIADALAWLHKEGFLERTPQPGKAARVRLLHPGSASAAGGRYVQVPLDVWRQGWLISLSHRALTIYLVLKEASGGRPHAILDGKRKDQYDLSDETWARGAAELTEAGLLEVEEVYATSAPDAEFETKCRRLQYTLLDDSVLKH